LFSGDDADKKIRVLSGGEKARVALAKTMISKANFLLLDEPTNHLDIHSTELLIDALNRYQGSYVLVSHDRYFVSKTANKIWEIVDHQIKEFKGGYEEWVEWKERMAQREINSNKQSAVDSKPQNQNKQEQSKPGEVTPPPAVNNLDREAKKELQKLQRKFGQLEEQIGKATQKKTTLELELSNPGTYSNPKAFADTERSYKTVSDELAQLNKEYEVLFEKIMELEEGAK
jgi:ATP-binding cassette subfamily F protein 3